MSAESWLRLSVAEVMRHNWAHTPDHPRSRAAILALQDLTLAAREAADEIGRLRAGLAESEQEPVAWLVEHDGVRELTFIPPCGGWSTPDGFTVTPLFERKLRGKA